MADYTVMYDDNRSLSSEDSSQNDARKAKMKELC